MAGGWWDRRGQLLGSASRARGLGPASVFGSVLWVCVPVEGRRVTAPSLGSGLCCGSTSRVDGRDQECGVGSALRVEGQRLGALSPGSGLRLGWRIQSSGVRGPVCVAGPHPGFEGRDPEFGVGSVFGSLLWVRVAG